MDSEAQLVWPVQRRGREACRWLVVLAACDLLVAFTAGMYLFAFQRASSDVIFGPDDNVTLILSGIAFVLSTILRDVVLVVGAAVVAIRWARKHKENRDGSTGSRTVPGLYLPVLTALVVIELSARWTSWKQVDPSYASTGWIVAACLINCLAVVGVIRRAGSSTPQPAVTAGL